MAGCRISIIAFAALPLLTVGCINPYACRGSDDVQKLLLDGQESASSRTPPLQFGLQLGDTTTVLSQVVDANACMTLSDPKFSSRDRPSRFSWRLSDSRVLSVDAGGTIRGVAIGRAQITVEANDAEPATIVVDVVPTVARIVVAPASATVRAGDTLRFDAYMADAAGNPISMSFDFPYPVNLSAPANQERDVENWIPGNRQQLLKRFLNLGVYPLRLTSVVRHVALDNATRITVLPQARATSRRVSLAHPSARAEPAEHPEKHRAE